MPARSGGTLLRHAGRELLLTALLFGFLYNLEFRHVPYLTGARLCLLFLVAWKPLTVAAGVRRTLSGHPVVLLTFAATFVYAAALSVGAGDWSQASRILHFLVYSVMGAVIWVSIEERWNGHMSAEIRLKLRLTVVTGLQSVFILLSLFVVGFRSWVSTVLVQGGNIDLLSAIQPPGFSNSSGALLSVIQAIGVFVALDLGSRSQSRRLGTFAMAIAGLNIVATIASGRTGLLMLATAPILFLVAWGHRSRGKVFVFAAAAAIIGMVAAPTVERWMAQKPQIGTLIASAAEIIQLGAGTPTLRHLAEMEIPALDGDSFVGTGRVVDGDVNASGHDSGYIQTYYALGIPMTLLFYGTVLLFFASVLRSAHAEARPLLYWLTGLMLLIELKEPFVFKYMLPFAILGIAWASATDTVRGPSRARSRVQ